MTRNLPRRSFLQSLAALGLPLGLTKLDPDRGPAGMAFPAPAPPPAAGPRRGFLKAAGLGMVQEGEDLKARFQLLAELGYDGVEMNSPNDHPLEEVLAAKEASGLEIHAVVDSVHWQKPFSAPDEETVKAATAGLERALRDAKAYGADQVLLVPAVVNRQVSYRQAWERSQANIAPLLPLARELGVGIAIENVWNGFLLSPLEFAAYIDAFDDPIVGAYLDVGNMVRFGWPTHWIEALGTRIRKVHVKGYSRKLMNDSGPWSGFGTGIHDGDCEWPAVLAALQEVGYDGWFTAEVGGGGRERLAAVAADLDRIMRGE